MFSTKLDRRAIQDLTDRMLSARSSNLKMVLDIDHRLHVVNEIDGVEFVNDAKSTTVNATNYSLKCMDKPVVWLLSCMDHSQDLSALLPAVQKQVKSILFVGSGDEPFVENFVHAVDSIQACDSMEEMLNEALKSAHEGEVVLYSSACEVSNTYSDYKARGRAFTEAVRQLKS